MFEKTKLYDTIYQKYGIKIHQLHTAVEKYNLNEDPDIIQIKNSLKQ